ncbi:MAG: PDZ domain-containing protein [Nannocystis sp.]|uniref:MXAN_5808 family serine peptidase n=1 Tax=Nannocystis sp. TaxID=1962667 RepID=UPI0024254091|nr:MXAN_5808 family serine peptidase [Nannocystis sp.]MBK9752883.1 PDZ domain-containing protein [Nannocystis sp.]
MTGQTPSRPRFAKASTPAIVFGSLALALGLTTLQDTTAQAQKGEPRAAGRAAQGYDATDLRILDWTLWYVAKYYVEPERIDPHKMAIAALEGLEKAIPQVLVEPVGPAGQPAARVRVRVGTTEQEFQIGDVEALWAVGTHVREVFRFVNRHTVLSEDEQRNAEYAIVEGVLGTLDPHTNLLRPDDFETMKTNTKGSFGGLGIEVGMRDTQITVIRVIDGNPAAKAGIEAMDRIVQIDEESTVTMGMTEAVDRMRGDPGTVVTLYVRRDGSDKVKKFPITRDVITLDSVQGDVLPGTDAKGNPVKVGLIQINRNFAQTTGKELRAKLAEFEKAGVRGVVLDMRDNPGGLLTAAVEVADAFLKTGTIVSTVGSSSPREELAADDRYDFPNLPVVVLIDQGSASATEIVAGALRNLGRAVLIGRRTFGKGSVQVLHDRKVGDKELALKLTIAQYLTPGDVSIQSVGVSPDLETIPVLITKDYTAYHGRKRFDLVREESLASHLTSTKADPSHQIAAGPLYFLGNTYEEDEGDAKDKKVKKEKDKTKTDKTGRPTPEALLEDPEIRMARDLVVWAPTPEREGILGKINDFVAQQTALEQARIIASLQKKGIDWNPGPAPVAGAGAPSLRMALRIDKPGNTIGAGESGTVTVTVTNEGSAPAFQVRAYSDSDYSYFDERELLFGRLDPGQTRSATLKLSVSEHELSRTDRIEWQLFEQHGATAMAGSQTTIDISSEGLPRPQFAYGYQLLDDPKLGANIRGNADGALQVGERVRMRVSFKNTGEGQAMDTWVTLRNLVGDAVFLHSGRENLKTVAPGDSRVVEFDLEVKKPTEDGLIKLQLAVADAKIGASLAEKLSFPLAASTVTFAAGSGNVLAGGPIDLYASPLAEQQQKVARAEAGSALKVLGVADGWYRVELDSKRFAFARASDVKPGGAGKAKLSEVLAVSPPKISLVGAVTQTDSDRVHISGVATDDEAVRDVYISVYNPARNLFGSQEKVFYQAAADPKTGRLEFAADVALTPGNNIIEIRARETDDVIATKQMWVLRTSGLKEARANEGKFSSNGKLAVDTLSK